MLLNARLFSATNILRVQRLLWLASSENSVESFFIVNDATDQSGEQDRA